jgi:hypothetical protein
MYGEKELCVEELRFEVENREDCPITEPRYIFEDVPSWFAEAMRMQAPDSRFWEAELPGGDAEASVMAFQDLGFWNHSWFDHAGWVEDHLIAEPYGLNAEGIRAIENFCTRTRTTYRISGASYHYPTATLRVEIFPLTIN